MKNVIVLLFVFVSVLKLNAQDSLEVKRKLRFPVWTTHSANSDILGLSLAAFPKHVFKRDTTLARTYGVRLEASIVGVFSPLMGRSPVSNSRAEFVNKQEKVPTEIIYGINLSSGTFGVTKVHGISSGLFIQYLYNMNGISLATMSNFIERHNGIAISAFGNEVYKSNGLLAGFGNIVSDFNGIQIGGFNEIQMKGIGIQIGIFNEAKNFKGLQIGLWNKNEKRSFPFFNWQFKG
ncbi:LA_2272 family surface repeat-containing protein [Psychroserpens luteolus]|uniref:LA_2272 family surface repeat-containing protein n=1 Tax=Psychroserpens luteolus TaxID=2855840 RepID=UPI001E48EDC7|nr:hypothetical protein [Psychroserpens luteolus]MCD2257625.1 hypothetical protein [Psychroserpens luteolus]